jgi:hypothetical protein
MRLAHDNEQGRQLFQGLYRFRYALIRSPAPSPNEIKTALELSLEEMSAVQSQAITMLIGNGDWPLPAELSAGRVTQR